MKTENDCEAIIKCYKWYGIDTIVDLLDGVLAFVILDNRDPNNPVLHAARDPIGVKPIFLGKN